MGPYQSYYHQVDPWLAIGMAAVPNQAFRSDDFITPSQFRELQIFSDYVKPHFGNLSCLLGAHIPIGDEIAFVGMHRSESLGEFPSDARRALDILIPPLRRVLQVRKRLADANARAADLEATLDMVGYAVLRCAEDAKIIFANRVALDILRRQDGLGGILGGRLAAPGATIGVSLNGLIKGAAQRNSPSSGALQIERANGRPPYKLVVFPLRSAGGAENSALIFIDDPDKKRPGFLRHIREIYGFTHAEAELALGLMSGFSPEDYAEARAVRITTVRTQIRSMMEKSSVSRQIDLITALLQIPTMTG